MPAQYTPHPPPLRSGTSPSEEGEGYPFAMRNPFAEESLGGGRAKRMGDAKKMPHMPDAGGAAVHVHDAFGRLLREGGLLADIEGMWRGLALPAAVRRRSL